MIFDTTLLTGVKKDEKEPPKKEILKVSEDLDINVSRMLYTPYVIPDYRSAIIKTIDIPKPKEDKDNG